MIHHLHDVAWMIGREDPGADRNRAHRVALREAQVATDFRSTTVATARSASPVRRLTLATPGTGSSVDLAACCA
jgi:hypothetical protein